MSYQYRRWNPKTKKMHHNTSPPLRMIGHKIQGKMIYQGDIIEEVNEIDGVIVKTYDVVEYVDGALCVDVTFVKDGSDHYPLSMYGEPINIVGNIYENSNLLK